MATSVSLSTLQSSLSSTLNSLSVKLTDSLFIWFWRNSDLELKFPQETILTASCSCLSRAVLCCRITLNLMMGCCSSSGCLKMWLEDFFSAASDKCSSNLPYSVLPDSYTYKPLLKLELRHSWHRYGSL